MKKLLFCGLTLLLSGCRTRFYDISYDHLRVGWLHTEEVHVEDSYYRIETTKGVEVRWLPEIPAINQFLYGLWMTQ